MDTSDEIHEEDCLCEPCLDGFDDEGFDTTYMWHPSDSNNGWDKWETDRYYQDLAQYKEYKLRIKKYENAFATFQKQIEIIDKKIDITNIKYTDMEGTSVYDRISDFDDIYNGIKAGTNLYNKDDLNELFETISKNLNIKQIE